MLFKNNKGPDQSVQYLGPWEFWDTESLPSSVIDVVCAGFSASILLTSSHPS